MRGLCQRVPSIMLSILLRRWAAVLAFAFVPVIGCASSDDQDEQQVAEARMLAWLDDLNGQGSFAFGQRMSDGTDFGGTSVPHELLLELSQAGGPAEQTSSDPNYKLALEGSFTLRRLGDDPATVATDVAVSGVMHSYGAVMLQFGDAGGEIIVVRRDDGAFQLQDFSGELGGESFPGLGGSF